MRRNLLKSGDEIDPMSVVGNLFDVAMVFAVALMVALVTRFNMTEMFSKEDFTIVKNPGKENMEIITKEGEKINRYTPPRIRMRAGAEKGRKWESHTNLKTARSFIFRKTDMHIL